MAILKTKLVQPTAPNRFWVVLDGETGTGRYYYKSGRAYVHEYSVNATSRQILHVRNVVVNNLPEGAEEVSAASYYESIAIYKAGVFEYDDKTYLISDVLSAGSFDTPQLWVLGIPNCPGCIFFQENILPLIAGKTDNYGLSFATQTVVNAVKKHLGGSSSALIGELRMYPTFYLLLPDGAITLWQNPYSKEDLAAYYHCYPTPTELVDILNGKEKFAAEKYDTALLQMQQEYENRTQKAALPYHKNSK